MFLFSIYPLNAPEPRHRSFTFLCSRRRRYNILFSGISLREEFHKVWVYRIKSKHKFKKKRKRLGELYGLTMSSVAGFIAGARLYRVPNTLRDTMAQKQYNNVRQQWWQPKCIRYRQKSIRYVPCFCRLFVS